MKWTWMDLNHRPPSTKEGVLPLHYKPIKSEWHTEEKRKQAEKPLKAK